MKISLIVAGLLGALALATPVIAQNNDMGNAAQNDAQATEDSIKSDLQARQDDIRNSAQPPQDTSQQADPTIQKFDKDGNPNYDTSGKYQGCHGMGCKVDNPDTAMSDDGSDEQTNQSYSRQTETHTSSSSFSFGIPHRGDDDRGGQGSWSPQSVLGKWTISAPDGFQSCTLSLYPDGSFGLKRAWTSAGCPNGFFSVNRWRSAGRNLQLTDMGGKIIGSFRQVGPGRFAGRRASDGAPVFLSRQ